MPTYTVPYAPQRLYDRNQNRIADLILRAGQIQGEGKRRSGEIWGATLANIGAGIGSAIAEGPRRKLEEQRAAREAQATEAQALQLGETKRAIAERDQFRQTMSSGKRGEILAQLEKAGNPDHYKTAVDYFAEQDKNMGRTFGKAAATIRQFGDDPGVAGLVLDDLIEQGYDPQKLAPYREVLKDPQKLSGVVTGLLQGSPDEEHRALVAPEKFQFAPAGAVALGSKGTTFSVPDPKGEAAAKDREADNARAERAQREAERHNRAVESGAGQKERLVQVMGDDGVPIWLSESQAVGRKATQAPRAVTGAERQSLAFYNRALDAIENITPIEEKVKTYGLAGQMQLQSLPNLLQTTEQQQYRQAQRAFTEARLRKESGAAIPPAEYENDAKTYFAQPGDSAETIGQKRAARAVVLNGLGYAAGRAYEEFYGQPLALPKRGQAPAEPAKKKNPFRP